MWRLYHPEVDSSIEINMTTPPTFPIQPHGQLIVLRAGESIGRRTIILAKRDDSSGIVIKEQYIEISRRFIEGRILEQIHEGGRFPGVVDFTSWKYVANEDGQISVKHQHKESAETRWKTHIVLEDKGTPFMDIKTPRELLMGIHDF
jgi:hypothetical protein